MRAGQVEWILYHHRFCSPRLPVWLCFPFMLRPLSTRPFSTSLSRSFPRQLPARATSQFDGDIPKSLRQAAQTEEISPGDFKEAHAPIRTQWSLDDIVENENDSSSTGHLYLAQQRQNLHYLRLSEHEMPKLVGECNPFLFTRLWII